MTSEALRYAVLGHSDLHETIDQVVPAFTGLYDDEVVLRVVTRDGKPVSVEIIEL